LRTVCGNANVLRILDTAPQNTKIFRHHRASSAESLRGLNSKSLIFVLREDIMSRFRRPWSIHTKLQAMIYARKCVCAKYITYLTGKRATRVGETLLPSPHQNHHVLAQNSPLWPCTVQSKMRYHSESTSTTFWHVRALCPVSLHRVHRR
jgi:hypothetical protein